MTSADDNADSTSDQRLADARAALKDRRRRSIEAVRELNDTRVTVQAKNRSFSIVFNGRSEVVDMTFHGTRYRSMAPAELAHQIVETMQRGRLQSLEKMAESVTTPGMAGIDIVGVATGKVDASKAIDSLVESFMQQFPGNGPGSGGGSRG